MPVEPAMFGIVKSPPDPAGTGEKKRKLEVGEGELLANKNVYPSILEVAKKYKNEFPSAKASDVMAILHLPYKEFKVGKTAHA